MPGNSEFRVTAYINFPADFSIQVHCISYLRLTLCKFCHDCDSQYSHVQIKNSFPK